MSDHLTPTKRSWNMSRIRSKDTYPEMKVRKHLYGRGIRYRLHKKDLPGKPDLVISRIRTVIFVHGCFWHQHEFCKRANVPKSRTDYWLSKLNKNKERDIINTQLLAQKKWQSIVIWECQVNRLETLDEIHKIVSSYGK